MFPMCPKPTEIPLSDLIEAHNNMFNPERYKGLPFQYIAFAPVAYVFILGLMVWRVMRNLLGYAFLAGGITLLRLCDYLESRDPNTFHHQGLVVLPSSDGCQAVIQVGFREWAIVDMFGIRERGFTSRMDAHASMREYLNTPANTDNVPSSVP